MVARSYSAKTLKIIFGLSGNQCAFPGCINPIIVPGSEQSDDAVLGHICHIFAAADNGPRGKPSLTAKQRNAPENLILMCGHHHPQVDTQWQDYPADLLKEWKRKHEAQFQPETAESIRRQEDIQHLAFTRDLTDQQIDAQVTLLRQARHLIGFPAKEKALALAASVERTELASGSSAIRACALAWCARILFQGDTADRARHLIAKSRELGGSAETTLAEAFVLAGEPGGTAAALALLAPIDTPPARSAMLRIVCNDRGAEGGIKWCRGAGLSLGSFDSDGKLTLISHQELAGEWADAYASARLLTEADFANSPMLLYAAAVAHLAYAVPEAFRTTAIFQLPFDAVRSPLADDSKSLEVRRRAIDLYERQAAFAAACGVNDAAHHSADMALWLRLRDPELHDDAMETLRDSLRDETQSLRRFPLAIQFGLSLDLDATERRINERVALTGRGNADEAIARLALAFTKPTPLEVYEYIASHREQLYAFLDRPSLLAMQVELLCQARQVESAKATLAEATEGDFDERQLERLQRVIAEAAGADPAAERRRLYEKSGDLRDLVSLVNFLEEEAAWQDLCPFAVTLFETTRSADDALRATRALERAGEHKKLLKFLLDIGEIAGRENSLQASLAWALFRDGQFGAASAALAPLRAARDHPNDRALFVNLAIASGNWDSLVGFTTSEWERRADRSAEDLLKAGQLAQAVGAPHARELIVCATEREPDNPNVLATAYFLATNAGWEAEEVVSQWLHQAAEKSGEDGPLKRMSMKELYELKPDWDRRQEEIYAALNEGSIPVSGAAQALNLSMISFCLLRPVANRAESDPRRRGVVFSFSGARPSSVPISAKRIALDLTSIFTFAQLGLLQTVAQHFERILIPDQTLVWLFQERQKASFHQPSRVKEAHFLKRLLADDALTIFAPESQAAVSLVHEVGFDLAAMLEAAACHPTPAYVVRSAPVHRVGTVMEELADSTAFEQQLCSCHAVVEALRLKGMITAAESRRALSYLKLHEMRWPTEPAIEDGATLFLDDVATTYLRTAGVLAKLKPAGFKAYVTKSLAEQDNQLIAFESFSEQQLTTIETIRSVLSSSLADGRLELITSGERDAGSARLNFLATDKTLDAFVVDDRFVNRYLHMTRGELQTPIFTSLDVIDHLASAGVISSEDVREHRTSLRRGGFSFVPIDESQLVDDLMDAPVIDGRLIETAELRAVREAALKLRMSKTLQVPHEIAWLQQYMLAHIHAARRMWEPSENPADAEARCEWLLSQLDMRGWAPAAEKGCEAGFARTSYAGVVHALSSAPEMADKDDNANYLRWIDERVTSAIKATEPEIFDDAVASAGEMVSHMIEDTLKSGVKLPAKANQFRAAIAARVISIYSPIMRDELLSRPHLIEQCSFETDGLMVLDTDGATFRRSELLSTVEATFDSPNPTTLRSSDGEEWTVRFLEGSTPPNVTIEREGKRFIVPQFALLAPTSAGRLGVFGELAKRHQLPDSDVERWEQILSVRTPTGNELAELQRELANTPAGAGDAVIESLRDDGLTFNVLVPRSEQYYERLVGKLGEATNLEDYFANHLGPFITTLLANGDPKALRMAWLLCSHSSVSELIEKSWSGSDDDLGEELAWLAAHGDPNSRIGAIEVGFRRVIASPALAGRLEALINTAIDSNSVGSSNGPDLLSALFRGVVGHMARCRVLASWPPFARRLAALAHVGLIIRELRAATVDEADLTRWLTDANDAYFVLQCLMDMRAEPRWFPELATVDQLRTELLGRVWMAAASNQEAADSLGLADRLTGDGPESLPNQFDRMQAVLPGPLEGSAFSILEAPEEMAAVCRAKLTESVVETTSFGPLVNLSLWFRVPTELVKLAVESIERSHFSIEVREEVPLGMCLLGLASVAAVTRSTELSNVVMTTLRATRRLHPGALSMNETFRIGVLACNANEELAGWSERVGQFMTELAFEEISLGDAQELHEHLSVMCHLVPELWGTCGQAEAGLMAVIDR